MSLKKGGMFCVSILVCYVILLYKRIGHITHQDKKQLVNGVPIYTAFVCFAIQISELLKSM